MGLQRMSSEVLERGRAGGWNRYKITRDGCYSGGRYFFVCPMETSGRSWIDFPSLVSHSVAVLRCAAIFHIVVDSCENDRFVSDDDGKRLVVEINSCDLFAPWLSTKRFKSKSSLSPRV